MKKLATDKGIEYLLSVDPVEFTDEAGNIKKVSPIQCYKEGHPKGDSYLKYNFKEYTQKAEDGTPLKKQLFYACNDFIIMQTFCKDNIGKSDAEPDSVKVYDKTQVDLIKLLIDEKIITFGKEPLPEKRNLESGYKTDQYWIDSSKLNSIGLVDKIANMMIPDFERCYAPKDWTLCLSFPISGSELAHEVGNHYIREADGLKKNDPNANVKYKRFAKIRRESYMDDIALETADDLRGQVLKDDNVIVVDDTLSVGVTLCNVQKSLSNAAFMKKKFDVENVSFVGFYSLIDLQRRKKGSFRKEALAKKMKVESFITIEDVFNVLYVTKTQSNNTSVVELKDWLENFYLVAKDNCEEKAVFT